MNGVPLISLKRHLMIMENRHMRDLPVSRKRCSRDEHHLD